MVIAARMGELCGGSQGFPCKGHNGFMAIIRTALGRADPLNTMCFTCWSSNCSSLLFMISCYTMSFGRIEGLKEKEPSVLCLSLGDFNAHPVKILLKTSLFFSNCFSFFQRKITFLIFIKLSIYIANHFVGRKSRKKTNL